MKVLALLAAFAVVSTSPVSGLYNSPSASGEVHGTLQTNPLAGGAAMIPKCFPHCGG